MKHVSVTELERDFISSKFMANRIIISSFLMNRMSEEDVYISFLEYNIEFHKLCLKYNMSDDSELNFDSMMLIGKEIKRNENETCILIDIKSDIIRNYYKYNSFLSIIKQLKAGKMIENFDQLFEKYKQFQKLYDEDIKKLSSEYVGFIRIDLFESRIFVSK